MVEAALRLLDVAHVPLAHERRFVSGLLQVLRKEDKIRAHRIVVVDHAMVVGVKPGEDRGPAWRTERRGHEGVGEMHAVAGHAVHVGGFQKRMPHEPHRVRAMVVGQHEENIRPLGGSVRLGVGRGRSRQDDRHGHHGCKADSHRFAVSKWIVLRITQPLVPKLLVLRPQIIITPACSSGGWISLKS